MMPTDFRTSATAGRSVRRRRIGQTLAAGAMAVLATGAAGPDENPTLDQTIDPDQEVATGPAELTAGHIDVGPRFVDDVWTLMIHDDAAHDDETEASVWRHPEETVFRVHDEAILTVPEDDTYAFLGVNGGRPVHVVPQTQDPEVVWLGWNTQDPDVMATIDRGVTLSMIGTEGPGHLIVYLQSGAFEEPDVLWDSRIVDPQPAWIPVNSHAHANWVFTEPGMHLVHLEVTADLVDGSTVSDLQTLRFAVGEEVASDQVLTADATPPDPDGVQDGGSQGSLSADDDPAAPGADGPPWTALAIGALAIVILTVAVASGLRGRKARRQGLDQQGPT